MEAKKNEKKKKYEKPKMTVKELKIFFTACKAVLPCTPLRGRNC